MNDRQQVLRRRFTYALLFYVVGFAICFTITSVLLKDLSAAFQLPPELEGTMSAITSVGSLLALVSMLFLQGRIRKSWVLAISGVVMALCMVLKGSASNYYVLLVVFFIFGIALGYGDGNCNAFIVDLNGANANRYLGALHAFSGIGAMLAPLMITWIRDRMSWQNTYFLMAAVVMIPFGFFLFMCFYMKKRLHTDSTPELRLTIRDVKEYLTSWENLVILGSLLLYTIFFNGLIVWVTLYTERVLGAESLRAYPLAVFWIFGAISRFVSPRLKCTPRTLFLVGTPLGGLALLLAVLARNPVILIIGCGFCGLFSGHCIPTLIGMGCARYQDRSGLPSSLLVIMQYIATTISPMIMAAISGAASLQESMIFTACCAFAATAVGLLMKKPAKTTV